LTPIASMTWRKKTVEKLPVAITVATYQDDDPPAFSREFLTLCRCQV
jgi:hypothetical protein